MLGLLYCFPVYIVCDGAARVNTHRGPCSVAEPVAVPAVGRFGCLRTYPLNHFKKMLSDFAFENV